MKTMFIFILLFSFTNVFASTKGHEVRNPDFIAPICKYVGTNSEGWYLENKLIKSVGYRECINKVSGYLFNETSDAGWYSFNVNNREELITYTNSFQDNIDLANPPVCKFIGTNKEGWYLNDELIRYVGYQQCESKIAIHLYKETNSEGWYSFNLQDRMELIFKQ